MTAGAVNNPTASRILAAVSNDPWSLMRYLFVDSPSLSDVPAANDLLKIFSVGPSKLVRVFVGFPIVAFSFVLKTDQFLVLVR